VVVGGGAMKLSFSKVNFTNEWLMGCEEHRIWYIKYVFLYAVWVEYVAREKVFDDPIR